MKIAKVEIFQYTLPLNAPIPLRQNNLYTRTGFLLKLYDSLGNTAWGEAAPLPGFSREDLQTCRETLIEAASTLMARHDMPDDGQLGALHVFQRRSAHSAAYFAVESAWRHLAATAQHRPPWRAIGQERDATLLLNALLTGDEANIAAQAERARALGFRAVKLKVGRERMTDDLRILAQVRAIIGDDMELRLDANQAWSLDDAILFGKAAFNANIAYIEEPCANPFELPAFHYATGLPYAIDESIHTLHDLTQELEGRPRSKSVRNLPVVPVMRGAQAIVWKPTLVHTPNLGKLLFEETQPGQAKILVLSASFESGVGTAALACYAALFGDPKTPVGLDTYRWLEPDILQRRLPLDQGVVDLHAICQAARSVDESRLTRLWPR